MWSYPHPIPPLWIMRIGWHKRKKLDLRRRMWALIAKLEDQSRECWDTKLWQEILQGADTRSLMESTELRNEVPLLEHKGTQQPLKEICYKTIYLRDEIRYLSTSGSQNVLPNFCNHCWQTFVGGASFLYVEALGASSEISTLWDPYKVQGKVYVSSQNFLAVTFQYGDLW